MKTFIVNLLRDLNRKEYVLNLLKPYGFLDIRLIEAVYGKSLSEEELANSFDAAKAYKRYGRALNVGEIGCTLSHFKCYAELLKGPEPFVLILEDDISVMRDFSDAEYIASTLPEDEPWVLFLSADYWYKNLQWVDEKIAIAKVYDAVGTYAYIINRLGAELIVGKNHKPSCAADHWSLYRRQGLKMYAVYPYMIDANIEEFESSINQFCFGEIRKNMCWRMRLTAYINSFVKKILLKRGHFVSKIRR